MLRTFCSRTAGRVRASLFVAALAALAVSLDASEVRAQAESGDLFYNYYVAPSPIGAPGAQMYICPRPTPPLVGHTYITYQPLMPHEFMVPHHRCYYGYNCGGSGWTKTTVCWSWNPFNQVWAKPQPLLPNPRPGGHVARAMGVGTVSPYGAAVGKYYSAY